MKHFLSIIILVMSVSLAISQDSIDDLSLDEQNRIRQSTPLFSRIDAAAMLNQVPMTNTVFIEQVGLNNVTYAETTSSQSQINIFQNGDNNAATGIYNAGVINASIIQEGNNNAFFEYVFGSTNQQVNSINSQVGDNLTLQKIGSNSISNGLQINMTGSDTSILVYSF